MLVVAVTIFTKQIAQMATVLLGFYRWVDCYFVSKFRRMRTNGLQKETSLTTAEIGRKTVGRFSTLFHF